MLDWRWSARGKTGAPHKEFLEHSEFLPRRSSETPVLGPDCMDYAGANLFDGNFFNHDLD